MVRDRLAGILLVAIAVLVIVGGLYVGFTALGSTPIPSTHSCPVHEPGATSFVPGCG